MGNGVRLNFLTIHGTLLQIFFPDGGLSLRLFRDSGNSGESGKEISAYYGLADWNEG